MTTENRYGIASANILDEATLIPAITWNTQKQIEVAKQAGFDGIEYWPIKRYGIKVPLVNQDDIKSGGILSAHQSFRPEKVRLTPAELKVAAFLPGIDSSFEILKEVNSQAGGIPVVLYRETSKEALEASGISLRQTQTDSEACKQWGASNAPEFLDSAAQNGFTDEHDDPAIVIDTHHVRHPSQDGQVNPLANWRESIPVLLPYTKEIHLGVGRIDFGRMDKEKIKGELIDLLNGGTGNTEVVQMLRMIADTGWSGLIVVEMRPSAVKEYLGSMTERDLVNTYERIRVTLHHIFERN